MENILSTLFTIIASVLSGVVLYQLKKNREDEDRKHTERQKMSILEREMLLGVVDLTIYIGRKVNNADSVNGELEESIKYLRDKKHKVQDFTREQYFEYREE